MENQSGPVLETVRVRVSTPEWVLAKYCLDNGITRITAREIKTALGIRNLLSLYNLIHIAIRDGLLKSVKKFSGVYEVNVKEAMNLTQLIPYDAGDRTTNLSDIPQWRQAIAYAKAWQALAEWARKALKEASEGTSPPAPGASGRKGKGKGGEPETVSASGSGEEGEPVDTCPAGPLPAVISHIPIDCVTTPSGRRALVAVLGNLYVLLEDLKGTHYLQCSPLEALGHGAKLCSAKTETLLKYLRRPAGQVRKEAEREGERAKARALKELETIQALMKLTPGTYSLVVHVKPDGSMYVEVPVPEEAETEAESGSGSGSGGVIPGSRGATAGLTATAMGTGTAVGQALYDPLRPPDPLPRVRRVEPIKEPSTKGISLVFDNVRFWANGTVQQLHGLQPLSTVLAIGDRLLYAEPGFQIYDPVLYELSKLMDIHIYHSKGKDPKGVIRIEARPRAKALKKLGLGRILHAFITYLHRLLGPIEALVTGWWRGR
jgi:hypothetical protein